MKKNDYEPDQTKIQAVIILLMIFTVFTNSSSNARSQQKTFEEVWINIPSCPLEFRMNSSGRYSLLDNRSSGRVVGFRLGCVTGAEAKKLKVVRKGRFVDTDLETSKGLLDSISVHTGEMERCYKMNAQYAVIEVLFKDGFTWKAK